MTDLVTTVADLYLHWLLRATDSVMSISAACITTLGAITEIVVFRDLAEFAEDSTGVRMATEEATAGALLRAVSNQVADFFAVVAFRLSSNFQCSVVVSKERTIGHHVSSLMTLATSSGCHGRLRRLGGGVCR